VHAVLALTLLLIATWLAVYKPFGVTPYGNRTNFQRQPASSTAVLQTTVPAAATSRPTGMYIVALVVLAVMLVIVVLHLTGTSFGH
jgi:hypothetical protein